MRQDAITRHIEGVAALKQPLRRELYRYVVAQDYAVSRDEVARALKISRELAAFHLDKLVAVGLLDAAFERRTGRSGPGAGRPAKIYRRAARQVAVALPPRDYELVARLLAQAMEAGGGRHPGEALADVAHARGVALGRAALARVRGRPTAAALAAAARALLVEHGFEPYPDDGGWRLRNCPFYPLSREHQDLICGMNLALMHGLLNGLGLERWRVDLDPTPGECCIAFRPRAGEEGT